MGQNAQKYGKISSFMFKKCLKLKILLGQLIKIWAMIVAPKLLSGNTASDVGLKGHFGTWCMFNRGRAFIRPCVV